MELIDSHCHIDFEQFDDDRDAVLAAASSIGVRRLINPGTNMASSQRAVALAQQHKEIFAAVGFHPYDAADVTRDIISALTDLAEDPNVVAIGEIGLDYYRDIAPKSTQRQAFEAQLDLAKSLDLPVIIHQREAADDTMAILRQWAADGDHPGLVLHAFSGDYAMVEAATSLGFHMGIGGPITFKNAKRLPEVVGAMPLSQIIVETDAPFLSPHPYRGKRNEPARVKLVAERLAQLLDIPLNDLIQQVTANTETLFRLPNGVKPS